MFPKQQVFFVLGLSKSGRSATEFLLRNGATTYIYDDIASDRVEQTAAGLVALGARRVNKEDIPRMSEICDGLVLSPGIPIDHPIAVAFRRAGRAVIGEAELAARYLRCPILAVTGTNGKTTVVSMLAETLRKGGFEAKACGNIGAPMVDFCDSLEKGIAVAEISSFQLETLNSLRPHVAFVLNVSEDHLNRHYTMENYVFLKAKLLKNLTETEYAVLNYDDPTVRSFAEKTKAQVLYFSVKEKVTGAYLENGNLYFGKEKILSATELPLGGIHNIQNALAVIVGAKLMGVKASDIASALTGFRGIRHRVEPIGECDGVYYVDDSKGTNVDATLKAVDSVRTEIILLLGGKNKGYDYRALFEKLDKNKVSHAVLYGENRYALLKSARECRFDKVTVCEGFAFAVQVARLKAVRGQTVLLSPASASFDEFASYEERGDKFVEIVRSFERENEEPIQRERNFSEELEERE